MMFDKKFDCCVCGYDLDESSKQECQKCHDSYCDQCVDSDGNCVPCD